MVCPIQILHINSDIHIYGEITSPKMRISSRNILILYLVFVYKTHKSIFPPVINVDYVPTMPKYTFTLSIT